MATRKRSTKRSSKPQPASRAAKARPKKPKPQANLKKKPGAPRGGTMPTKERRRRDPETLRLRTIMPGLTASDLDQSIRFYTGSLGFIVSQRWSEKGVLQGVSLKAGACELNLSQDDWSKGRDRQKGEGVRLWCETGQDIAALAARIKAAGERLVEDLKDQEWGVRSFSIDDPDGYHLTIFQKK